MVNKRFYSGKTYSHATGHSCAFRQWRADSHCNLIHGYALQFELKFGGELDDRNWIVDFGGLKPLKAWLEDNFDHKVILDEDDPMMEHFEKIASVGLCELSVFDGVGVEKFAEHACKFADKLVKDMTDNRCFVVSCECAEHGANSAIYHNERP